MKVFLLKAVFFVILISMSLLMISFLTTEPSMDEGLSNDSKILYKFLARESKVIARKYHLEACGTGVEGMDKISMLGLSFNRFGQPINEKEARKLIIQCVDDFLLAINNEDQVKSLLKDYPFKPENLELSIFNYGDDHVIHYFPSIAIVANSSGKINFLTEAPSTSQGYYTEKRETYEEAVAILSEEKKADGSNKNK